MVTTPALVIGNGELRGQRSVAGEEPVLSGNSFGARAEHHKQVHHPRLEHPEGVHLLVAA